jgi:hypothetical protein
VNLFAPAVFSTLFGPCLVSCAATVGTGGLISVPKDSSTTCTKICTDIGLSLGAVVVMASEVGCVCSAAKPNSPDDKVAAAAGAGMATIAMQQEELRRRQNNTTPASK